MNQVSLFSTLQILIAPRLVDSFVGNLPNPIPRSQSFHLHSSTVEVVDEAMVEEARNMDPIVVDSMPPPIPENLNNKYYFLRHGQSTANVAEVISSARSLAYSEKHGLTSLGYEQGKASAKELLDALEDEGASTGDKVVFVSSPFARARQTAEACLDGLAEEECRQRAEKMGLDISSEIVMENRLMERYFGRLDNEAIYTYAYVWPLDQFNVTHTAFGVESVAAVCTRLSQVVERYEAEHKDHHIVCVSHADVLQIGQLYGANVEYVGLFSSYRFKNGEVRAMKRTSDSLPEPVPLEAPRLGTNM
jgi:broad specificity phosphatase PhoE